MGKNKKLQEMIGRRGIKKKSLAEKVGVSGQSITNILNGSDPRVSIALLIAKVLKCSVEQIFLSGRGEKEE